MTVFDKLIARTLPYVPKPLVWQFSKPYVAGNTIDDAVRVVKELNAEKVMATIDVLGEFIHSTDQVAPTVETYKKVLDVIDKEQLEANISIKLTAFGLLLDKEFCADSVMNLIGYANSKYNNFVRIDMEDSACTDDTIEIYERARKQFPKTGLVIQAYLRRSMADVQRLIQEAPAKPDPNLRICKGIYIEPEEIAFKDRQEIRQSFVDLVEMMIKNGRYVGIATHDEWVVTETEKIIKKYNAQPDQYEYQMLLGVLPDLRRKIQANGHRVRVYVPFGKDWYGYCTRRLKENPALAGHVLKNLVKPKK
ncbi:MAG: proline dehydrogenase [Gemmatimonadetes bacterium]|nr:MAG: proline dehydrogenase [Gemmatimonadota bacterium]